MNYFPFHLGDYAAHTAHLEPMEDLAYRRMLDLYYLREHPLPPDAPEVARLIRMRQYVDAVSAVLSEFFTLSEDGWRQARCDKELERMQDKQAKAKASAAASVNARRANAQRTLNERSTDAERSDGERSTDVELPTPTPTPTPTPEESPPTPKGVTRKRAAASAGECPADVPPGVFADFVAIRKAKRAPLTSTAMDGIVREAQKAGISLADALAVCCERGWSGFRADWYTGAGSSAKPAQPAKRPAPENFSNMNYGTGGRL